MSNDKDFDVKETILAGRNLIEASAGTGKTYSVSILVLRLIIENKIPLEKILMVTFTKDAVAELESRVRKFVRQALRYASGKGNAEKTIREVIDSTGKAKALPELKKATQSLDELSVMTIHSFCERSLMQYPFETGQSFKFSISTDISDIRDLVVNDFWRRKINTLDKDLFKHFTETLTRDSIEQVLKKALDDKVYICDDVNETEVLKQIKESIKVKETAWKEFKTYVTDNFDSISVKVHQNSDARKFLEKNNSSSLVFIEAYIKGFKCKTQYIKNSFLEEFRYYTRYEDISNSLTELSGKYMYNIFKQAIEDLKKKVSDFKANRQIIDFNDQIKLLHKAVVNGSVNPVLSSKYLAVFIDEFQDTDKYQYEIFSKLFSEKIIFYIGDPKQSIFGWRKADITTYKKARDEVNKIHSMDLNFRSTQELIDALNAFFSGEDPFADNEIRYEKVKMGRSDLGSMTDNNNPVEPMDLYGCKKKSEIEAFVVNEVCRLIYSGEACINGNVIEPSDIAIIVRTNKEGRAMKKALSKVNVPAITVDETKVMESEEAQIIRYLMEAVIQPNRGAINRVLLNQCFGLDSDTVLRLDEEKHLENFRELKQIWHDSGVYNMLFRFFDIYQVRFYSLKLGIDGQRILTNFYHIAEILHKSAQKNKYTPNELLVWSQRAQNDNDEEYEQRIESQDNAVQVTTIHRSKGLTYKIVFTPFLDLKITEYPIYDFRDEGNYYFTHKPSEKQVKLWHDQIEQENRRLIYVALTRAQYKAYVCINNFNGFNDSAIKKFPVENRKQWDSSMIKKLSGKENNGTKSQQLNPRPKPEDLNIKNSFGIHSYSALSKAHHSAPFEKTEPGRSEKYDQFIFQELGRGANVGTALHSIFERLDFSKPDTWLQTIRDASKYYPDIIREKDDEKKRESNLELIHHMVNNVIKAEINCNGAILKLSEIADERKLPELDFSFSVNKVNRQVINQYLGEDAKLGGDTDIEGLMTGFMDLVFEHKGKFYILDWKSNHLGNDLNDYNNAGMEVAMTRSNYHLQYMIYTVALKRWLEKKITGFDFDKHFGGIIYVFLRGVHESSDTGIFTKWPARNQIEDLDIALGGCFQQTKN